MTPDTSSCCLDEHELHRFCAREMTASDANRAAAHLAECIHCTQRRASLEARHESWIRQIRALGAAPVNDARPVQAPLPIDAVPGYLIEEEIKRGGQGIVFRALQKSTSRTVAIKVLRDGLLASTTARQRFEREIELVASLRHPNIVSIFDSGVTTSGLRYYVMDHVQGLPLNRFVATERLSLRDMLSLFVGICDAVNHAHLRGVIHRDLKPSNILVDDDGRPKVLDFGLARLHFDGDACSVTVIDTIAGTLAYLSPEQATGEAADMRSDVYALGVILYQLLTGKFPYPVEGELTAVLRLISSASPAPPSDCRAPDSPSGVRWLGGRGSRRDNEMDTIVLKCLSKERDRRYQTAGELGRDITRYLAGEPIDAKRDSSWYVLRKALQRHRVPLALTSMLALSTLVAAVALMAMYLHRGRLLDELRAQQQAAQLAEERANRRYAQLRELANAFIQDLDPMIQDLSGSASARRFIVSTGLEYLNGLAADSQDDPQLQCQLASAYVRLGDIQGNPQRSNLGNYSGALANYEKAQKLLQSVAMHQPDNVGVQIDLSLCYHRMGQALFEQRKHAESAEALAEARRIIERLHQAHPDNATIRRNRGNLLEAAADAHVASGRIDEALAIYHQLLAEQVDEANPHPNRRDLAVCHYKLGGAYLTSHDAAQALVHFAQYVAVFEDLVATEPQNALTRTDLGFGYERLSLVQQQLGRHADALATARRQLATQLKLSEDPNNRRAINGVRAAYCRIGEAQLALGEVDEAIRSFAQFAAATEDIARARPDDPAAAREMAVASFKMAEVHMSCGADEARSTQERADHWRTARGFIQDAYDRFVQMRAQGELSKSDEQVPQQLDVELKRCDSQIAALSSNADAAPARSTSVQSEPPITE